MKVQHPAFAEIVHDVEGEKAAEHLAAGWVEVVEDRAPIPVEPEVDAEK